jgi:L-asparaginase II
VAAAHVPVAVATRGGTAESVHYGSVAVVDAAGRLIAHCGDALALTFSRSALKPFQAMPFVAGGGAAHFGWGTRELALACASHNGEEEHAALAAAMLKAAGFDARALQCGEHTPLRFTFFDQPAPLGARWDATFHNCSGKHSAMLAWCVQHGVDAQGYLAFDHPLQVAIRASVAHFCGVAESHLAAGIDGCSAPNYAMPLSALARAFARLAMPQPDSRYGAAPGLLFHAMVSHPHLVAGEGRNDVALMQVGAGDWAAKIGAEGVQGVALRNVPQYGVLGIAIKVADGAFRALHPVTVSVLDQLGVLSGRDAAPLAPFRSPVIRSIRGEVTGQVQSCAQLTLAA